ncbi:lantibiotic dehydratase [Deminuibacter soli]|uniref:Lantibiotic dehydratase n=1 Tax=Deminuibacter soli TaxID=2291815 RepID=A0A3E1NRH2_9BACT|nr:lantibiotic dehydratase [Deminuibacter soli]RFM30536.1 hypothetical protein DXN05_06165 [Deminuibacter soli]
MKNSVQLKADPFYLIRRPLLPVNTLFELNKRLVETPDLLWPFLHQLFNEPLVNEAIYLASPELHSEFGKLRAHDAAGAVKMAQSLYKYLVRMCTRATPYGLFAGCSAGTVAAHTQISYAGAQMHKKSRLDMLYVCELVQAIAADPAIKKQLRYFPNNSLYTAGNNYRYVEYSVAGKKRAYTVSAVQQSPYLQAVLEKAACGLYYNDIVAAVLETDATLDMQEIGEFIDQLISAQLLVSELEPSLTGDVFFDTLAEKLQHIAAPEMVGSLQQLRAYLQCGGTENYCKAHELINEQLVQTGTKDLVQTDLFFTHAQNTLGEGFTNMLTEQLAPLFRLSSQKHTPELDTFKQRFQARFDTQEVPLLLALDIETGVGYGTQHGSSTLMPLVGDIDLPAAKNTAALSWNGYTQLLHTLYSRALQTAAQEVQITDEDLAAIEEPNHLHTQIAPSLFAFGSLLAKSSEAIDKGDFRFLLATCNGPSAANLLGRFCYGDEALLHKVKKSLAQHEPDTAHTVYAEIVHLPEARVGNVLQRPCLRNYEIPFLGKSGMPQQNQLPVNDLMVSVQHGKVVLRSKKLNKRVIPRMATAHQHAQGLPVYRFLCDLQRQQLYYGFHWKWEHLAGSDFLPRVVYKNIILSKASWQVKLADITGNTQQADDADRLRSLLQLRNIPVCVSITEHDNELLADWSTTAGLQLMLRQLQKKGSVQLTEFLHTPDNCFVTGDNDALYANEIIVPLHNPLYKTGPPLPQRAVPAVQRSFAPGSEWVYWKLYGGAKDTETILKETITPFVQQLRQQNAIDGWFFIRYTDPEPHIRLRMHLPKTQQHLLGQLICGLQQALQPALDAHLLHSIQLDTYERELERYGAANIEDSEQVFFHDSNATAAVLTMLDGEDGERWRWLLAMRSTDMLLNTFGLTLNERKELMNSLSAAYFREFNGDKNLSAQLNDKFRAEGRMIRSMLNPADDVQNQVSAVVALFAERDEAIAPVLERIACRAGAGFNEEGGMDLLRSYLHMSLNRFFPAKQRLHELGIYYLLYKHYMSSVAILKSNQTPLAVATV